MGALRKRKCCGCGKRFTPSPQNKGLQRYCSDESCRKLSKQASQAKWQKKNPDYFKGSSNVKRVQDWRKQNPGYWRLKKGDSAAKSGNTLQDSSITQAADDQGSRASLNETALQDSCFSQLFVYVGLISMLMGSTLQGDIVNLIRTLHVKGHEILGTKSESDLNQEIRINHEEKNSQRTTATPDPSSFQLDRSPFNSQWPIEGVP